MTMITKTSRRAILAGAAALPVLAVPALASVTDDPIFAAIEKHRRLWDIHNVAFAAAESSEAFDYAGDRQSDTHHQLAVLLKMTPTTTAGSAALLRYIDFMVQSERSEYDSAGLFSDWNDSLRGPAKTLLTRIAATLEGKAVQS